MMLSLARHEPATANVLDARWQMEKSKFMGTEITGKKAGIIGCGNIGAIVANRAQGLKMRVAGFDPYLTPENAKRSGIRRLSWMNCWHGLISSPLHTPLTDATRNIISADALNRTKASRGADH